MVDVARLGLAVDSSQVERGTATLHQLTGAAGQASAAAQRLAGATNVEAAGHKAAASATQVHTAAIHANNAAMRMGSQVRTNMIYQLNDVGVSLASGMNPIMVAIQQIPQMLQFGLKPALDSIVGIGRGLLTTFGPLMGVLAGVTILLQGMTNEINAVSGANVSLMDTTLAVFESIASGVQTVLGPAMSWLQTEWDNAVNQIFSDTAREVNAIIGLWVGSVDAIKAAWDNLPAALGFVIYEASKNTVNGVIYMIREVQVQFNKLMSWVDHQMLALGAKPLGIRGDLAEYITMANPHQDGAAAAGAAGDAFNAAQGRDYVGDWMGGIGTRAQEIAAARAETEELGSAADAANGKVAKLLDQGLGNLTHWTTSFGEAAKSAFSNLGSGIIDAFKKGGDIASNVLNMLMDKVGQFGETLLNNGLNGLLNAGLGALGSAFGGGTWGQFGGFSGFAGSFGIPGMATGGTVGRAGLSWVGEQGPELLRLPQGAEVIPNGRSMSMAANQNSANDNTRRGDVHLHINGSNLSQAEMQAAITDALDQYDRFTLPNRVSQINSDPLARG